MKKMKKIFALLLALAMVLGMTTTAFAADGIVGNSDDTGSITVANVENNLTVKAYPIAMAQYDETTGAFIGYSNPYDLDDIEDPTQAELAAIAATVTGGTELVWDATNSVYTKDGMAVGMYLICVTGSETVVYNVAVASIQYLNNDGINQIKPGQVDMVKNGTTWVKKSDAPDVDKYMLEDGNKVDGNTVDIGDIVNYEVSINPVPNYGGNFPVLNVVDTLEDGLAYQNDLVVKVGETTLTKGTHYTLDVKDQVITVDFVVNGKYTLNEYTGKELIISYTAKLTDKAKVDFNEDENVNTAVLTYSKDSKTEGNNGTKTVSTYTATFDITDNVLKTTEDGKALAGATFEVYTDADCKKVYRNEVITNSLVTDAEGRIELVGLDEGTYYLKEIAAPDGYSVNTTVYEIKITATHTETGEIDTWTVEAKPYGSTDAATSTLTIVNTKLSALPSTGGIGTTIFTIGGCAIMIAAAFFFFVSRRKEA